jgi:hypothetical protein
VRRVLWISVAAVALWTARAHLTRLLDVGQPHVAVAADSHRAAVVVQEEHFSPWEDLEQLDSVKLRTAKDTVDIAIPFHESTSGGGGAGARRETCESSLVP